MKTYVVNLRRRLDRREWMERSLPAELDVLFTSDWEGPFDGAQLDLEELPEPFSVYKNWELPFSSGHRYWDRPLRPGEVGCTLSHLHVWQRVAEEAEPCLILEDDIQLAQDFSEKVDCIRSLMRTEDGPGLVYLGRSGVGPEPDPVDGLVSPPGFSYGSFGYLLTPEAAVAFLQTPLATHIIPVDEFLPAMYMAHPRPDIRMLFVPTSHAAAAKPPLVTTDLSMGSDSETTSRV